MDVLETRPIFTGLFPSCNPPDLIAKPRSAALRIDEPSHSRALARSMATVANLEVIILDDVNPIVDTAEGSTTYWSSDGDPFPPHYPVDTPSLQYKKQTHQL
eukprot:6492806-Amphidinium_carterae.1